MPDKSLIGMFILCCYIFCIFDSVRGWLYGSPHKVYD